LDKETLCHYLTENSRVLTLSPTDSWQELRAFGGLNNNYVLFNAGTTWTEGEVRFLAVKAEHSDKHAIGVIICAEGKNYYVTGDTLYSEKVFESLPNLSLEAVFLPINGKGNNMNFIDAARFVSRTKAKYAVPMHIGTFDDLSATNWEVENKIIPKLYEEIQL
jgi:L-ascorbate metabolism protein UlaG (beta-lactamase superfamily)